MTRLSPAVLLAAPFRMPIDVHGGHIGLVHGGQVGRLLPLYGVLAAAALALAWRLVRGERPTKVTRELAFPVAAFVAKLSTQFLIPHDLAVGAVEAVDGAVFALSSLEINAISLHGNRSVSVAQVFIHPQPLRAAGGPRFQQSFFFRKPIAFRAAPLGPVECRC